MKTINETAGGAQVLLNIDFDLQKCFEERFAETHKTFLHMVLVLEEAQKPVLRPYSGRGRKPLQHAPFMRSIRAKSLFGIEKTGSLIARIKSGPNLRLLCGLKKVPGKASFSRAFSYLPSTNIGEETLKTLVTGVHKDRVAYHVCRDATSIEARKKREG